MTIWKFALTYFVSFVMAISLSACVNTGETVDTSGTATAPPEISASETPVQPIENSEETDALVLNEEDKATEWTEPALEALVREKLNKPSGDIMLSDLSHIWAIELFGETHIYFNADGGYTMYGKINGEAIDRIENPSNISIPLSDDGKTFSKDGLYSVEGEQYTRGSISSLKDFANFRNLMYLSINKNALTDLSGLSDLKNLTELTLPENDIKDISALAELSQISSLSVSYNPVNDPSPLGGLVQLRQLYVRESQTADLDWVKPLTNLEVLNSIGNPVNSLEPLAALVKLEHLMIENTDVGDLSPISGITSLRILDMGNLNADSIDLAPVASLENLTALFALQDQAEMINPRAVAELKNLSMLDVISDGISDEDVSWLRDNLPDDCSIQ